jgi:replication factor C small subunit
MSVEFLWVEKYRPQTINDCVLTDEMKNTFQAILDTGELPNMMFNGTAGTGKTTVARALCNELNLDHIVANVTFFRSIDYNMV